MLKALGVFVFLVLGTFFLGIFFYETKADDNSRKTEGLNLSELVSGSDDFEKYRLPFMEGARMLIASGECTPQEIKNNGGWMKSEINHKINPVYFTFCGGYKKENRIYLDVSEIKIFR